ncbi:MAG: amino acid ABC transporter permease [Gemmiger sp.]|nr:amino acid ABC transporter permease [Gemmiger sp.]
MDTLAASFSIFAKPGVMLFILRGVCFTLVLSVVAVLCGILFGSLLALLRNYAVHGPARVLGWLATVYIEIFRNTPYLLWIFICLVACPCPGFLQHKMLGLTSVEVRILFRASMALILFTSSVIAEIVRGGLNAVAAGQFEAGRSQGFSTVQIICYIVLPQAYRAVVPTLLSQVITTIKDSSYLANVAVIELMARVRQILSTSYMYNGTGKQNVSDVFVLFGLACILYFIINFSLSCLVRKLQKPKKAPGRQPAQAAAPQREEVA